MLRRTHAKRVATLGGYAAMLVVAALLFLWIRSFGMDLTAPPAVVGAADARRGGTQHLLAHVLFALAVITISARLVGGLFERFLKQPPVIGEIVAGLMLGPSVLGALWPAGYAVLLPTSIAPHLGMVAQIGVVLFMFLVGLELNPKYLREDSHATLAISHASIIVPFLLGAVLALLLYPLYSHRGVEFTVFALFIGVSLSVTAFPVLARILTDRRAQTTELGVTALACAAVDDATAWCLLALVSGIARATLELAAWTVTLTIVFAAFMLFAVRPLLRKALARAEARTPENTPTVTAMALVFAGILLSAVATEAIGIHALFGAFLFGAIMPHGGWMARHLRMRLEDVVLVLLLPVFFTFTGMRTRIDLVASAMDWALCGLIVVVATVGKFGGSFIAARLVGMQSRDAAALGILMNTRGLMELVVLNVGLDMGILSPTLFAMLVLMALITTFSTTPVLNWIRAPGATPA